MPRLQGQRLYKSFYVVSSGSRRVETRVKISFHDKWTLEPLGLLVMDSKSAFGRLGVKFDSKARWKAHTERHG